MSTVSKYLESYNVTYSTGQVCVHTTKWSGHFIRRHLFLR